MAQDACDELTEHGILSDHPDVTMAEYVDLHGEPVYKCANRVVFADSKRLELSEWFEHLDVNSRELRQRMHELAREVYGRREADGVGDPWSQQDPVVFDAGTFDDVDVEFCEDCGGIVDEDDQ